MGDTRANFRLVLLIIILLCASSAALGISSDFDAYSNTSQLAGCRCNPVPFNFHIHNNGAYANQYSVSPVGSTQGWISYYPDSAVLGSGQTTEIDGYVNPSCDAVGPYQIQTQITTDSGITKVLNQNINIYDCFDFDLTSDTNSVTVVCGDIYKVNVLLSNKGIFPQTFLLGTSGNMSMLSIASATLLPNTQVKIPLIIAADCTKNVGVSQISAAAVLNGTENKKIIQIEARVLSKEQAYGVSVIPTKLDLHYSPITKSFYIKNNGLLKSNYTVIIDPNKRYYWIDSRVVNVELEPQQAKKFTADFMLTRNLAADVAPGKYNTSIMIFSQNGLAMNYAVEMTVSKSAAHRFSDWYAVHLKPYMALMLVLLAIILVIVIIAEIVIYFHKKQHEALIRYVSVTESGETAIHHPEKQESYNAKWHAAVAGKTHEVVFSAKEFSLKKMIFVTKHSLSQVGLEVEKIANLPDKAKLAIAEHVSAQDIYEVYSVTKQNLNNKDISSASIRFLVNKEWQNFKEDEEIKVMIIRNAAKEFSAKLLGHDHEHYYYESVLDGFSYIAIIRRPKKKEIVAAAPEHPEDKKPLVEKKQIKQTAEKEIKIETVEEYAERKEKKRQQRLGKYADHKSDSVIGWIALFALLLILIAAPFYFASGKNNSTGNMLSSFVSSKENSTLQPNTTDLITQEKSAQQVNVLITFIGQHKLSDSIYYQILDKNSRKRVVLSKYFPDKQNLTYSISKPGNVSVSINQDELLIIPPKDWFGVDSATLYVSGKDGLVYDSEVMFIVRNHEPTFGDRVSEYFYNLFMGIKKYQAFIVSGIIILVLLVLAIRIITRDEKKKR